MDLTCPLSIYPHFILRIIFILALSSLFMFSHIRISYGGEAMDEQKASALTTQDNGKEIRVKCGEIIQIELKDTVAAGYGWYIVGLDDGYLDLVTKETRRISPEGAGETPKLGVWSFKTKKKGITGIKMGRYRPSWEGPEKTTEYFSVKLEIA